MSVDANKSAPTRESGRKASEQAAKSQGQWAIDGRAPLNHNEEFKAEDPGIGVRERIENIYAKEGFASIPSDDLRGRFRWWGLYTQRKPGIDGGKTAVLEPHELDDEYFMMRVRSDGGALSTEQARVIAAISTEFARNTADITDRQNIQLHWVRVEDVPEIWRRLEAVGLSSTEACGDVPRVILGSPVAGIAADEIIDGTPAIEEIQRRYIGTEEFANLPRKFKSAISGSPRRDVVPEINDIAFIGVVHPEHGPGFDLWVGGGLSTNPRLAERLGAWVPLDEVPEVWAGVISLFRDYGYRRLRTRARLKFLVADWGVAKFREVLETEYLNRPLIDGPEPQNVAPSEGDHIGVHAQNDGLFYVGAAPLAGRISGSTLAEVADIAETHGSQRIRLTAYQKLLILDVAPDRVDSLVEALANIGLPAKPSPFRRATMACTGIEYCKLAIVNTKDRAAHTVATLEKRLDDLLNPASGLGLNEPITLHINGCPNSCARIQVADIGLKGQIVTTDDGRRVEGFQVHLGGGLGLDAGFGRKLRGHKVIADDLPDYVEGLVRAYVAQRHDGERFAQWVVRADEADLRAEREPK